jgi:hypothetical protein
MRIVGGIDRTICSTGATFDSTDPEACDIENEANAIRIVACVNACEGINPEAIPDMLEALNRLAAWADVVAIDCPHLGGLLLAMYGAQSVVAKAKGEPE